MLGQSRYYVGLFGLVGLFSAVKAKLLHRTVLLKVNRRAIAYPFSLRVPSSDVPTYEHVFVCRDYDFVTEVQPEVIVDAGAYIGFTSIYFANKYPAARILAVEPENENFKLLRENVAPYKNVIPIQAALWNEDGEVNLVDPGRGDWGFTAEEKDFSADVPDNVCNAVKTITVAKLMEDYGLDKIDILKVNIEGAEKEVFSDTSAWIDRVNSLVVELHEHLKSGCNRSFYSGAIGFDNEWKQGKGLYLTCLSRGETIAKCLD